MKTEHTPGPWHVHEGGNFIRIGSEGYDEYVRKQHYLGGPFSVAEVEYKPTIDHHPNHALAMANARLLAAAPDLLAACQRILELGKDANCGLNEVEAAIRKALNE